MSQHLNSAVTGVCYIILTEDEWYSATEQQREAWQVQCMREAVESNAKFATLFVDPDPVMSISPVPRRHKVWGHSFVPSRAEQFRSELAALITEFRDVGRPELSAALKAFFDVTEL